MPKNQKSLISLFFEHPRKVTKIKNFLLFGMTINDFYLKNDFNTKKS